MLKGSKCGGGAREITRSGFRAIVQCRVAREDETGVEDRDKETDARRITAETSYG